MSRTIACLLIILGWSTAALAEEMSLPDGFAATVFHPGLGRARHIAVRENGDVYVARQYVLDRPRFGLKATEGAIVALRDTDADGTADVVEEFGPTDVGTGIGVHAGHLYFSSDVAVYRIPLTDQLVPDGVPEPIAGGFPLQRSHGSKGFTFDQEGNLYVNSGSPSNACQEKNNKRESPGKDPCPELQRSGGIWRFSADEQLQDQLRDGERYVSGTRNVMALAWNNDADRLFFVMHGRDSVDFLWPKLFTKEQRRELPAEEFHAADQGDNFGWPYTYYDGLRNQRMVSPEYGGDGTTPAEGGYRNPLIAFPAHWAPNDMLFHSGKNLPERYAGGAFIVFHGSWNRIPFPQEGFNVVFVPIKGGELAGQWEVFAEGFIGDKEITNPGKAKYRPTGIAEGPNGAIYLSEDKTGRIWRITASP